MEGHLMRPLCKTVPKIHVMHDIVRKRFPGLKKHRVEIKKIEHGKVVSLFVCLSACLSEFNS
jgi:hypothetical protein